VTALLLVLCTFAAFGLGVWLGIHIACRALAEMKADGEVEITFFDQNLAAVAAKKAEETARTLLRKHGHLR
jgi:hypothetical protein